MAWGVPLQPPKMYHFGGREGTLSLGDWVPPYPPSRLEQLAFKIYMVALLIKIVAFLRLLVAKKFYWK